MKRSILAASLLLLALSIPGLASGELKLPEPRVVVQGLIDAAKSPDEPLTAYFIDVGQGDATLIVSPEGRAVLVDAGPRAGGPTVLDVMRRAGIEGLDLVIVSHPHLDHIGGLRSVLESVPVRYYMDPGYPHSSRAYEQLLETLEALDISVLTARAGRQVNLGGGATLEIIAPEDPLHAGTRSDVNANSVVARVDIGDFCILLTGDAEAESEQRLLDSNRLSCTVLKVPHHGSRHSSTSVFLEKVGPEVAIIQVGAQNSYGHPHPDTIERLEAVGATVYRNDLHGTITLTSDGLTYTVSTEQPGLQERRASRANERHETAKEAEQHQTHP